MSDEERKPIRRALISVSDKDGLIPLAKALAAAGVEILSTGGTARLLAGEGLDVTDVSAVTGFPEIMDGRVKTLHPKIHGGLLGRPDLETDRAAMDAHGIAPIDLLVCNLYPFEQTVARGAPDGEVVENIDIGGPAMIRAAAKNHAHLAVATDRSDYVMIEQALEKGGLSLSDRRVLAGKAFARTAAYDSAVAGWFAGDGLPDRIALTGVRALALRYGENPHQAAALYRAGPERPGVVTARQVQGKALSYNNINDTDAAVELAAEFDRPAIAIIKHANPCGVAVADGLAAAYDRALSCDPVSAFGGIIAANRPLDGAVAARIADLFAEVVIAPDADGDALDILAKKKNLRVLLCGALPDPAEVGLLVKTVAGGLLVQGRDNGQLPPDGALRIVTRRGPTESEWADMRFAWAVAKHVKSNAIVLAKDGLVAGIGAGQMSRVDSCRLAAEKAAEAARLAGEAQSRAVGSAVASDAFFPFADGLEAAIASGATAAIQPGGSVRDEEVIAAADKAGIAMVFTGSRHFRH